MRLTPPKTLTFLIALALAAAGIVLRLGLVTAPVLSGRAFWFETAAFALLALAVMLKGL